MTKVYPSETKASEFIKDPYNKISSLKDYFVDDRFILVNDNFVKTYFIETNGVELYLPTKEKLYFAIDMFCQFAAHQIAHFVELNNNSRLLKTDFGFYNFGLKYINLKNNNNKNVLNIKSSLFFAALSREIRVTTIERIIQSPQFSIDDILNISRKRLDNIIWENTAKALLPYGKFKTYEDVLEYQNDLITKTFNHWSIDKIRTTWFEKLDYIFNWMETNENI